MKRKAGDENGTPVEVGHVMPFSPEKAIMRGL